jgi:formate dehydrogenase subunit gamma
MSSRLRVFLMVMTAVVLLGTATSGGAALAQSSVRPPGDAQSASPQGGNVPGNVSGNVSDAEIWRKVRHGVRGEVSIPDKKAGTLVQSEGEDFRQFRNGPLAVYGAWSLLAIVVLLAAFFLLRGRIRIEAGPSGRTVLRFNVLERMAHWLTAGSFIVLGVTGLNMLYGKAVLMPVIGKPAFALLTMWGKYAHNFLGFAFTAGVVLMIVLWLRDNLPNRHDLRWLAVGGGLFTKGVHPPAKKFNAGQKFIFWTVVALGLSLATTGFCLLYPFEFAPFAGTFKLLNMVGFDLPTELTPLQETQLALLWHSIVALVAIVVIIAHIYIGSLGMEGAIDAVTSGEVDENWAHEHHALWLDEMQQGSGKRQPAE